MNPDDTVTIWRYGGKHMPGYWNCIRSYSRFYAEQQLEALNKDCEARGDSRVYAIFEKNYDPNGTLLDS